MMWGAMHLSRTLFQEIPFQDAGTIGYCLEYEAVNIYFGRVEKDHSSEVYHHAGSIPVPVAAR